MDFQTNLTRLRMRAGFKTAKDFAAAVGIPYPTYAGYENKGREPKFEVLCKIADTLCVSVDELIGHEVDKYRKMYKLLESMGFEISHEQNGAISVIDEMVQGPDGKQSFTWWDYDSPEDLYAAMQIAIKTFNTKTNDVLKSVLKEQFYVDDDRKRRIKDYQKRIQQKEKLTPREEMDYYLLKSEDRTNKRSVDSE